MAHDRQLPEELREPSKDLLKLSDKANQSLDVLANWWALFAVIYRDDPPEQLGIAFRNILKPLLSKPEVLHEALLIAARQSPEFRPKPGRVYEIAEGILASRQTGNRPKYLDEPPTSKEEIEEFLQTPEYQELRKKIARNGT